MPWLSAVAEAAPAPLVLVHSPEARAPLAMRLFGECAAVGLRALALVEAAGERPDPRALMAAHRAAAFAALPGVGGQVQLWWALPDGGWSQTQVQAVAGDDDRALAIRVVERLRAELLPLARPLPRPTRPMPLPEPATVAVAPVSAAAAADTSRPPAPGPAPPRTSRYDFMAARLGLAAQGGLTGDQQSAHVSLGLALAPTAWLEIDVGLRTPALAQGTDVVTSDGWYQVRSTVGSLGANWTPDIGPDWLELTAGAGVGAVILRVAHHPDEGAMSGVETGVLWTPYALVAATLRMRRWLCLRLEATWGPVLPRPVMRDHGDTRPLWRGGLSAQTLSLEVRL